MTTKSQASATTGKAPKGTSIDEVKALDDDELDYEDTVENDDAGSGSSQTQEPSKDEKSQDLEKHSNSQCHSSGDGSTECKGDDHLTHKKPRGRSRSK